MKEFFENVGLWFVNNWPAIVTFLTSSTFITVITNIVFKVKSIRENRKNKVSQDELKASLDTNSEAVKRVDDIKEYIALMSENINTMKSLYNDLLERYNDVEYKISAILDVLQLAYSTIKNEDIRTTIQKVIANAKLTSLNAKNELEEQLRKLREKIEAATNELKEQVENQLEEVQNATDITKSSPTRY